MKIFPDQWRTIAPMLCRTATQCIERFEQLCDLAMGREHVVDPADDPRKLRAGEIDPTPEARPARPDAVDMDEDEKQMVQQARARLANTKGKKAKRKAREKHLEEARRLAQLQKLRELKAAGIVTQLKEKNKTGIDYNAEIPFLHVPSEGSFSIEEERQKELKIRSETNFIGADLAQLNGETAETREMKERAKDAKKERLKKQTALPEMVKKLNELNDPIAIRRRTEFVLPAPALRETELEELARHNTAPGALEAALLEHQRKLSVPKALEANSQDVLMAELRNLINIRSAPNALAGGDAVVREQLPGPTTAMTTTTTTTTNVITPRSSMTPLPSASQANRIRALLNTLPTADSSTAVDSKALRDVIVEAEKVLASLHDVRDTRVLTLLQNTAAAANTSTDLVQEDAELSRERRERIERARKQAEYVRLPQAIKRGLPRPLRTNKAMGASTSSLDVDSFLPRSLVIQEVIAMLRRDEATMPVRPGVNVNPRFVEATQITEYTEKELSAAAALVKAEYDTMNDNSVVTPSEALRSVCEAASVQNNIRLSATHPDVIRILAEREYISTSDAFDIDDEVSSAPLPKRSRLSEHTDLELSAEAILQRVTQNIGNDVVFDPISTAFKAYEDLPKKQQAAALRTEVISLNEHVERLTTRAESLEKSLLRKSGGYQQRMKSTMIEISRAYAQVSEAQINLQCFKTMQQHESSVAIPTRVNTIRKAIEAVKQIGVKTQEEFQKLSDDAEVYAKVLTQM